MTRSSAAKSVPAWAQLLQKGSSSDALHKKLSDLRERLVKAEQGKLSEDTLEAARVDLLHDDIMFNKLKEVRTLAACCHAEILRLYAPDSPYSDHEVEKVFQFFLTILTNNTAGLFKPKSALFPDCVALLSSLVTSRSFALLCDRGKDAGGIIQEYFEKFFQLITNETQKNVELLLADALTIFMQYSTTISPRIVGLLVKHLDVKTRRLNASAHHLAEVVGNNAADELQSSVAQHFVDEIVKAANVETDDERQTSLQSVHAAITHIHKYAPPLLCNVLPQLDQELRAEDVKIRCIAITALGNIFADRVHGSVVSAPRLYAGTWKAWLDRGNDKSVQARLAWTNAVKAIIVNDADAAKDILPRLETRLSDLDEKVRIAVVKVISTLPITTLRSAEVHPLLRLVGERVGDVRASVGEAAIVALARLFDAAFSDVSHDKQDWQTHFGWIPNEVAGALLAGELNDRMIAARTAFARHIVPLPDTTGEDAEARWTSRVLDVLGVLHFDAFVALTKIANLQQPRHHYVAFVGACKQFNGGIVESSQAGVVRDALLRSINLVARSFGDPLKAGHDLHTFAKLNDNRSMRLLETLMDAKTDLKTTVKSRAELLKRVEGQQGASTLHGFIDMATFPIIHNACIPALLTSDSKNAALIVKTIAKWRPEMMARHVDLLRDTAFDVLNEGTAVRALALMSMSRIQRNKSTPLELTDDDVENLARLVEEGTAEEAKWSASLIACVAGNVMASGNAFAYQTAETLCEKICNGLATMTAEKQRASLETVRRIVKYARGATELTVGRIADGTLENILMKPCRVDGDDGADWIDDENVDDDLGARLSALRFVGQRCLAFSEADGFREVGRPMIKLLLTCLVGGQPADGLVEGAAGQARMRGEAAQQLLRLSRNARCDELIGVADWHTMATALQDEVYNVRQHFLGKLIKNMMRRKSNLPPRMTALSFMVAFDPEDDVRGLVRTTCNTMAMTMPPMQWQRFYELALPRVLHLVNHHPDFKLAIVGEDGVAYDLLEEAARYIDFYLDCCTTGDNFASLYHLAVRCKGMRDVMGDEHSKGLHALSELTMMLIKRRAEAQHGVVGGYYGDVKLPRDLFVPYESREELAKAQKATLLDSGVVEGFLKGVRRDKNTTGKRKAVIRAEALAKEERSPKKKARRLKKQKDADSSDEDISDSEGEHDGASNAAAPVSDDEDVIPTDDEDAEGGRGARIRAKRRQEARARNADRQKRREAQAA